MTKFRISKKSEESAYRIPKTAQQTIDSPVSGTVYGRWVTRFSRTWRFSVINFAVADDEDKAKHSHALLCLGKSVAYRRHHQNLRFQSQHLNPDEFQKELLMQAKEDDKNDYRREYNRMMMDKAAGARTSFKTAP